MRQQCKCGCLTRCPKGFKLSLTTSEPGIRYRSTATAAVLGGQNRSVLVRRLLENPIAIVEITIELAQVGLKIVAEG